MARSTAMRLDFPKAARVRTAAEYSHAFAEAKRFQHPWFQLVVRLDPEVTKKPCVAATPAYARLGLAVSRKVDRRAVQRGRIKRVVREAFRHVAGELAAGSYVFVGKPGAATVGSAELRAVVTLFLRRAAGIHALPLRQPVGTMPDPQARPAAPAIQTIRQ